MKLSKIVIGLLIVLTVALIPSISSSKETNSGVVVLSKSNTMVLNTQVDGASTSDVIAKAKALDTALSRHEYGKKAPLYLFLNTPGGSIQAGLEMIEALKGIDRKVDTVTLFAASMGFQIAQNLDDRLILKNGVLMSHRAAGEIQGSFGGEHPSQMDSRYQLWIDRMRELDEQTVSRTNGKQTYESYTKQYANEMWLTGTKSVQQGYADRIVTVKCDSSLNGTSTKHVDYMGMDVSYDLDNCPLNTTPMNIKVNSMNGKALTTELENKMKSDFLSIYENKQRLVIPMVF